MPNPDQTQTLDVDRIRAGLKAVRQWGVLSALPLYASLASEMLKEWMASDGNGVDFWIPTVGFPLLMAALVMSQIGVRRLNEKWLAGPTHVLTAHYRSALNLVVAYPRAPLVFAGMMAVAGSASTFFHVLPGLVLFLGGLYPLVRLWRLSPVLKREHAALPPQTPVP